MLKKNGKVPPGVRNQILVMSIGTGRLVVILTADIKVPLEAVTGRRGPLMKSHFLLNPVIIISRALLQLRLSRFQYMKKVT